MFKKRWKKILFWTLSVIVVLGVSGLFAANYAVDKLMNSMVDSFDAELDDNNSGNSNRSVIPTDVDNDTASIAVPTNTPPVEDANKITELETSQNKDETTRESQKKSSEEPSAIATSKPVESTSVGKETSDEGYSVEVSTNKAATIKESVTVKEKADVASIVMGQLSISDIKRLQELAKGGLTSHEKYEARSIILGKVSEEQYNELAQIAKKYGVSQGKTRDQVVAEIEGSEQP